MYEAQTVLGVEIKLEKYFGRMEITRKINLSLVKLRSGIVVDSLKGGKNGT